MAVQAYVKIKGAKQGQFKGEGVKDRSGRRDRFRSFASRRRNGAA